MRIRDGFWLEERSGQMVVAGEKALNNYIVLSDTTVFLWNLLKEKEVTKAQMLEELLKAFDISTVLALGDIDTFIRTMRENGIIE